MTTNDTPTGNVDPDVEPAQDAAAEGDTQESADSTDWKSEARKWEQRAKDNKSAADELAAIKESQKSESERLSDQLVEATRQVEQIPAKVAEGLRAHLVKLHGITDEDAELFLTSDDPDVLLRQAARFTERASQSRGVVPTQGTKTDPNGVQVSSYELGLERAKARFQKQ